MWISPDQCNDMHTNGAPCPANAVATGDAWLQNNLPSIMASTWYQQNGIIIITWDESSGADTTGWNGTTGGHVPTLVISNNNNKPYTAGGNLYGILRGIQLTYGLACLGASCDPNNGDISKAFGTPGSGCGCGPAPGWAGQRSLGDGPLGGDPQAIAGGVGRSYVFWRGTDNSLWYDWYNGAWHGAAPLTGGSALKPGTDPHPVATGNGTIDVFWEGGDGNLWHVWEVNGSGFAPPTRLGGGPLGSQPQPVSSGHGDVAVFWMGSDASANLWEAAYRPSTGWRLPIGLGSGPLGGAPHAAAFATTSYDVFWQGTDGNIWHTYSFGSSWSGPQFLGMGPLGGDPIAISAAANTIDLYWRGLDGGLWHGWYSGGWHGPATFGGNLNSTPWPLVVSPGNVDVFWRNGTDVDHLIGGVPSALNESTATGSPTALSWTGGHEEAFWKGNNSGSSLWHDWTH